MQVNRREVIIAATTSAITGLLVGCADNDAAPGFNPVPAGATVDIGTSEEYPHDGKYYQFLNRGIVLTRLNGNLSAMSAVCTHRRCALNLETDGSYHCKCHGSTFDAAGKVTEGPAKRDLPMLAIVTSNAGKLLVQSK